MWYESCLTLSIFPVIFLFCIIAYRSMLYVYFMFPYEEEWECHSPSFPAFFPPLHSIPQYPVPLIGMVLWFLFSVLFFFERKDT